MVTHQVHGDASHREAVLGHDEPEGPPRGWRIAHGQAHEATLPGGAHYSTRLAATVPPSS